MSPNAPVAQPLSLLSVLGVIVTWAMAYTHWKQHGPVPLSGGAFCGHCRQ
jgi:hypothetical protein